MVNFSEALDKALERYGISAKWLSEQSGVSQQMISQFRNGKQRIYSDSLEKLLAALPNEVKDYFFGLMSSGNLEAAIASMTDAEVSDLLILLAKRFNKAPKEARDTNLVSVWGAIRGWWVEIATIYTVAAIKLEDVKPLVEKLSPQEKAELVKELIGNDSGLQIVLGGSNCTSAEIATQIQTASSVDIFVLLEAVAYRLRQKGDNQSDHATQSNGVG